MRTKLAVIGAVVLLMSVAAGGILAASPRAPEAKRLSVFGVSTAQSIVDLGGTGFTQGDLVVDTGQLSDEEGTQVGTYYAHCLLSDPVTLTFQCNADFALDDGNIATQGAIVLGSSGPFVHTISGGTGKFRNVGGESSVTFTSQTERTFTFQLSD